MKRTLLIILTAILFTSCSSAVRFTSANTTKYEDNNTEVVTVMYGKASYYGSEFEGRNTSNGETFSNREYTAAHKSLPFGSLVKVTNLANNKSVIVRINDRGPYVAGRVIDLTRVAAEELDMIRAGIIDVKIELLK
ncbi:MAG: septal ring lytic transglycosylase RlpA family lipoprotein [Ignavibacteriae bacterium HGW-Ignavibacteriae-4]|jgi:rare lipoprotein A|nr:MAG: septal ring lytic transglycosylase RlpA family lipoprotein [Ignavibacteriae bacterium HGW-Ignavibacteriae-4]